MTESADIRILEAIIAATYAAIDAVGMETVKSLSMFSSLPPGVIAQDKDVSHSLAA